MRNGFVEDARKLFDEMPSRNTVTYNSMISGYFSNDRYSEAVAMFDQLSHRDLFSYNTMITGLMKYGDVEGARVVFDKMPFRDVVSWNSMIAGYVRNSFMNEGLVLFNEMPVRNLVSWNLVMSGLVHMGNIDLVEQLFSDMERRDVASWTIMISGLLNAGRIGEARGLFEEMPVRDDRAWNTMLSGYITNERISDAVRHFGEMPCKSLQSWNWILLGLVRSGNTREAHAFFEKNPFNDIVSWTNMVIGYFELGEVTVAIKLFNLMPSRDETAWNATIFGLGEHDHGEEGLKLFMQMAEWGPIPDEATYTSVLTICSVLPSLDFGKQAHGRIIKMGYDYFTAVSNAIITMYARCGSMYCAQLGFTYMPAHDVVSWNSIICGFANHGAGVEASELFHKMRSAGVKPDQITFIGVLSACSHSGLLEQGRYYFSLMRFKYFIHPTSEHYTCMVDLLGKSGFLDEAVEFISQMRVDGVKMSASLWGALLGACRIHRNVELGEIAAEKVLKMEPCNIGAYLILAEMFLTSGRVEDAERIFVRMKESGAKKQPGCSWVEVNNSVHVFLAGDGLDPKLNRVCFALELMNAEMEFGLLDQH
ncbi:hypothetical protein GIB67_024677 [Kingdonia uniflora]|uniref:Chlororespiratory reduction 4 n=1 Tax=Kingdonia uniflora TaxID=39325 RepID=A0A7J7LPH9_9MAGN|nr:hypothetical protein GIB67_024677 [Kingdonia uniflora]